MTWLRTPSTANLVTRALAIMIVVAWSVLPGFCGGLFEFAHVHAEATNHHDNGEAHGTPHGEDQTPCCRSLADAKVLTVTPVEAAPVKVVLVDAVHATSIVDVAQSDTAQPVAAATGPPRTRQVRLLSYNPLAPPTHSA